MWHTGKPLLWIYSFLCSKQERVVVTGVKSSWTSVFFGVTLGTVLDPFLHSLYMYVSYIRDNIDSEIGLLSDDCGFYRQIDRTH